MRYYMNAIMLNKKINKGRKKVKAVVSDIVTNT
jgi:hypothetical protein